MGYKYQFTEQHPPLLKDIKGPPTGIPPSDLVKQIGATTWTQVDVLQGVPAFKEGDLKTADFHRKPITQTTIYKVNRTLKWVLSDVPHHYALDITRKVKVTQGYSRTERVTFATTFGLSTGGSFFGFKSSVKADLKITNETEQQWKVEQTEETETKFQANHWYASWTLIDVLDGTKHVSYDWGVPPVDGGAAFNVITAVYDDSAEDRIVKLIDMRRS